MIGPLTRVLLSARSTLAYPNNGLGKSITPRVAGYILLSWGYAYKIIPSSER